MPGRDKTGPEGMGPGTGRGLGPCGLGLFRGRRASGRGRRLRLWPRNKNERLEVLREYKKSVEEELEDIKAEEREL